MNDQDHIPHPSTPSAWRPRENAIFIIAEAGVNHNGDISIAKKLIDVAASSGADAVKFQTFKTENLVAPKAPKATYQLQTTDATESQFEMLKRLELSEAHHRELLAYCREKKIGFLSTPFDEDSADFLDALGMAMFKIPSGEITNLPFLKHVAAKDKPLIVSTGMSTLGEVETAVHEIQQSGNKRLALLHCVANYPASVSDVNLRAMITMQQAFQISTGYSDHTEGIEIALAAVALGACIIEKHFTLDRNMPGPDHKASLEPGELVAMVRGIRNIERALGHGRKEPASSEASSRSTIRKSLVAARTLPAGSILSKADIAIMRPGTGLPPTMRDFLIGRRLSADVSEGDTFSLEMFV